MPLSGNLWPAHPKLLPDELLSSWIVRIAGANGLKLQTFCDRTFGKEHQLWNRDIDRHAPPWLLASLARHTGTPIRSVQNATLGIYRGRLYRQKHNAGQLRWILPAGVYHRTRRRFGVQFCPRCLAEDDEVYFRTRWRVAALTFCAEHQLCLHDRCPACEVPIAYHRRELGHPNVTDPGSLCLCHACNFDLRNAAYKPFVPYENSVQSTLVAVSAHVNGDVTALSIGHMDVMHQLCKTMVSLRESSNLSAFATRAIGAPDVDIPRGRQAFESRPIEQRDHVIQLATWVLAAPHIRLVAAWQTKAIRYNHLVREFPRAPKWYQTIVTPFNLRQRRL